MIIQPLIIGVSANHTVRVPTVRTRRLPCKYTIPYTYIKVWVGLQYYFAIFIFLGQDTVDSVLVPLPVITPWGGIYNFLVAYDIPTNHVSKLD